MSILSKSPEDFNFLFHSIFHPCPVILPIFAEQDSGHAIMGLYNWKENRMRFSDRCPLVLRKRGTGSLPYQSVTPSSWNTSLSAWWQLRRQAGFKQENSRFHIPSFYSLSFPVLLTYILWKKSRLGWFYELSPFSFNRTYVWLHFWLHFVQSLLISHFKRQ